MINHDGVIRWALSAGAILAPLAAGAQGFTPPRYSVQQLPSGENDLCQANSVNDAGTVVGWGMRQVHGKDVTSGLIWTAPSFQPAPLPAATHAIEPDSINAVGEIAGMVGNPGTVYGKALLIGPDGTQHSLSGAMPPGSFSLAASVNGDGQVAGYDYFQHTGQFSAFVWTKQTGRINLGYLDAHWKSSAAYAINDSGSVVGESQIGESSHHAVRWTQASGMVDLGKKLPGAPDYSWAAAQNNVGQVAISTTTSGAYVWDARSDSVVRLPDPPEGDTLDLQGINDAGVVVGRGGDVNGYCSAGFNGLCATAWYPTAGGWQVYNLNDLADWPAGVQAHSFLQPAAINGAGQIVVNAFLSDTIGYCYLLTPEG